MKRHSHALDDYFETAFERSMIGPRLEINKNPYAIVALGGYGREEQCIHSDVDLLFLFAKRVPPDAENLIREMIYPLWDIGMDVGYATRSVKECLSLAAAEFNILTPLLDARFICGMSMLFSDLMAQLRDNVIRKRRDRLMDQLLASTRSRQAQFGDSAYLLEPHLKEGQGGLRDYHAMLWMARLDTELRQTRDLEYLGLLSHSEYQQLLTALDFIWAVRNHLHHISGRKTDRLHFENQIRLAEHFRYRDEAGQQPVERFLGELHGRMDAVKRQHLMLLHEFGLENNGNGAARPTPKSPVEGIEVVYGGMLDFARPEAVLKRPELLVRIFEESAVLKAPLSAEAKRLVREFVYLVDAAFRCGAGDRAELRAGPARAGLGRERSRRHADDGPAGGVHPGVSVRHQPDSVRRVPPVSGGQAPAAHGTDAHAARRRGRRGRAALRQGLPRAEEQVRAVLGGAAARHRQGRDRR